MKNNNSRLPVAALLTGVLLAMTALAATPVSVTLTTNQNVDIVAAPGAGYALEVSHILAGNTSATAVRLDLKEGNSGTVRFSMPITVGGGYMLPLAWHFSTPRTGEDTTWLLPENTALVGILSAAVTDVRVNVLYRIVKLP